MKSLLCLLLLAACTRQPESQPCPRCERCAEIPVALVDAGVPAKAPEPQWRTVTAFETVLGEWTGLSERVKIERRPDSKTPYNVQFKTRDVEGGCGFYPTGTAFCDYASGQKKVENEKTLVSFALLDGSGKMQFSASGIVSVTVERALP